MKKFITVAMVLMMVFAFTACGTNKNKNIANDMAGNTAT